MGIRFFGLFAMLAMGAVMAFILLRWPRQKHRSISMHVADRRGTFLLFAFASTLSCGLFYVFLTQWLAPALQLPDIFTAFVFAALACQLAAAWIPCLPGRQEYWHSVAAYAMAALMPVLLVFVLFSPVMATALKFFTAVAIAWMTLMLILLVSVPRIRQFYLPLQLLYIWIFYIIMMLSAFTVGY